MQQRAGAGVAEGKCAVLGRGRLVLAGAGTGVDEPGRVVGGAVGVAGSGGLVLEGAARDLVAEWEVGVVRVGDLVAGGGGGGDGGAEVVDVRVEGYGLSDIAVEHDVESESICTVPVGDSVRSDSVVDCEWDDYVRIRRILLEGAPLDLLRIRFGEWYGGSSKVYRKITEYSWRDCQGIDPIAERIYSSRLKIDILIDHRRVLTVETPKTLLWIRHNEGTRTLT